MPTLNCKWCKRDFKSKHSTAKFCNKAHYYAYQRKFVYKNQEGVCQLCHKAFKATNKEALFCTKKHSKLFRAGKVFQRKAGNGFTWVKPDKRGVFIKDKAVYQNKIIDYPEAPMGKAFIGLSKTPLMPNEGKHGFQGVLLQDESRQFIQCSNCGEWMKRIGNTHVLKCSKGKIKTTAAYKKEFGLYKSTGLVSDETSLKLTAAVLKNKDKKGFEIIKAMANEVRPRVTKGQLTSTREHQNRTGSCPEQLKYRLKQFILRNRELPNSSNKGRALYKSLSRKFESLGKAMEYYGLPGMERWGTTYLYSFPKGDVVKFNINKSDQREQLFEKMIMECDLFDTEDRDFYLQSCLN